MPDSLDLSAIIISLNSRHYLFDCLKSLDAAEWRGMTREIIVVDNGSTDGTVEMLRQDFPQVRLIANSQNLSYCRAGNQGAAIARGRYLLFLNDDILILDDALPKLVEAMDSHPEAGMIGSRLLNHDGTDQFSSGRTFTTPMSAIFGRKSVLTRLFPQAPWARKYLLSDRVEEPDPYSVDWLSAAAMMVRAEVFQRVGGLAEDYYYFHEQVFCQRVLQAGYSVLLHPQSKIIHFEGVGSGVRTRRVRRRHIERFHRAAHRWFCHYYRIGLWNPARYLAAAILFLRASWLILVDSFRGDSPRATSPAHAERPEGGIPL